MFVDDAALVGRALTTAMVAELIGRPESTLKEWVAKGWLGPTYFSVRPQGGKRYWTPIDLLVARAFNFLGTGATGQQERAQQLSELIRGWADAGSPNVVLLDSDGVLRLIEPMMLRDLLAMAPHRELRISTVPLVAWLEQAQRQARVQFDIRDAPLSPPPFRRPTPAPERAKLEVAGSEELPFD